MSLLHSTYFFCLLAFLIAHILLSFWFAKLQYVKENYNKKFLRCFVERVRFETTFLFSGLLALALTGIWSLLQLFL